MKNKINKICTELNDGKIAVVQATEQLFDLYSVSQQRELLDLLTEIANSDTLYSNTRHRMIARKLLKSNCG